MNASYSRALNGSVGSSEPIRKEGHGSVLLFAVFLILLALVETHRVSWSVEFAQAGWEPVVGGQELISSLQDAQWDRRIGFLGLAVCGLILALRRRGLRARTASLSSGLLAFLALWILASVGWADDPSLAVRRALAILATGIGAFGFAKTFSLRDTIRFLFVSSTIVCAVGLVTEIALGAFSPADAAYRFSGTLHPNHQAWACAAMVMAAVGLWTTETRHPKVYLVLALAGFAALVLTKSRTSTGACVIALFLYAGMIAPVKRRILLGLVSLVAIFTLLLVSEQAGTRGVVNTLLLGRSSEQLSTFSGRTQVWGVGVTYFLRRPLLGYGFGAFATPRNLGDLSEEVGWVPPTMHSEYLDVLLGIGLVGAVAWVSVLALSILRTCKSYMESKSRYLALSCAISAFCVITMFLETMGRDPGALLFVFFVDVMRRTSSLDGRGYS